MKAQGGSKPILILLGILFLAIGGIGIASTFGVGLPFTIPTEIMGYPAMYIFGGLIGLGILFLIIASRMW